MKIKEGFVLREVAKQYVVIPVGTAIVNFNGMLTLNGTAKLLFESLETDKTIEELVDILMNEYEIDFETAMDDVKGFLTVLKENNILE